MIFIEILKVIFLGIVQGITEWLPVSSTGHMIILDELIHLNVSQSFLDTFLVVIQFGSILAVLILFFHKLNPFSAKKTAVQKRDTYRLWAKVLVAAIPGGLIGFLFEEEINKYCYNPWVVAGALIVYGILFIVIENRKKKPRINKFSELSYKTALGIGIFQILALIPGTSRSGSTILGAVLLGSSRYVATEFSFFLAVPMMLGASGYKLLKTGLGFTGTEWMLLLIGILVAFLVSVFAIKFLMGFIKKHDFKAFGYYRIVLGVIVIVYFLIVGA